MKKYNFDYEKLSAYIDGELPLAEKNELEREISLSPELQKKLLELKKVKELTEASYKKLPESPYLETRIMANLKHDKGGGSLIKRSWIPVAGLVVVTVVLMVILKYNPTLINKIVQEQSSNLAGFYKENLKPLLYASSLSNEDIFNFAFYKELPLDDNKEQFLQIGNDSAGNEFFELKKSSYNIQENNYEKFVTAMNLDARQKQSFDSILQHYAGELQTQVLVNNRNAVAINPNLWNYNKAIAAELVQFASNVNEPEFNKLRIHKDRYLNPAAIIKIVDEVKASDENNYIFLTPDTIFTSWIDVDSKEMKEELIKVKKELYETGRDLAGDREEFHRIKVNFRIDSLRHIREKNYRKEKFGITVGDNNYRVQIQGTEVPQLSLPDMDSITAQIENAMRHVQVFTVSSPKNPTRFSKRYNFQYGYKDSLKEMVVPSIPELDSMMNFNYFQYNKNNEKIDSLVSLYMPQFKFKHDSLTSYFKMFDDSSRYLYEIDMQKQLKEIETEMRRFREEMEKLRKDINENNGKKDSTRRIKKPIEV